MFRANTVLVLGAAASLDFEFPLGKQLKSEIATLLRYEINDWGKVRLDDRRRLIYGNASSFEDEGLKAGRIISEGIGFASSVDNFLEMRKNEDAIVEIGKRAIVQIILEHERACGKLQWRPKRQSSSATTFDKTWHQIFSEICFERCERGDLPTALSRLQVVSFNYDRCFEQFVRLAISSLYSIPFSEACKIADEYLKVWHPYGSLGKLRPEGRAIDELPFGSKDPIAVGQLSSQIKTFTEQEAISAGELSGIRDAIANADTVVFLGWGYHPQNIKILSPMPPDIRSATTAIGTAVELSPQAIERTRVRISTSILKPGFLSEEYEGDDDDVELSNMNCEQLLNAHRQDLLD